MCRSVHVANFTFGRLVVIVQLLLLSGKFNFGYISTTVCVNFLSILKCLGGHRCGFWLIGCVGGKVCRSDKGTEVCVDVGVGTPGYGVSIDPLGEPSNPRGTGSVGGFGEMSFPGGSVGAEASYNPYGPDGMLPFSTFLLIFYTFFFKRDQQ